MNRRWVCNDVWMDIFPLFDRPQLGLKLALISPRFDALVDKHFDGKTELTLWKWITLRKENNGPKTKLFIDDLSAEGLPLPDRPLPNKICFKAFWINHIDHSVITFLHANQQIWDSGTDLELIVSAYEFDKLTDIQQIWDTFVSQIWPFFSANIRHLCFSDGAHLDNLCHLISPTMLSDLTQLNSICSDRLCPDGIANFDESNVTAAGQVSKWLHIPTIDGQPKRLYCFDHLDPSNFEWINNFKEVFVCANTAVSYTVNFQFQVPTPIVPFELVNERTKEKLKLKKHYDDVGSLNWWIMQRYPFGGETAAVQWKFKYSAEDLNVVNVYLSSAENCIGPLSPPAEGQSNDKMFSSRAGPSSSGQQRRKKKKK